MLFRNLQRQGSVPDPQYTVYRSYLYYNLEGERERVREEKKHAQPGEKAEEGKGEESDFKVFCEGSPQIQSVSRKGKKKWT